MLASVNLEVEALEAVLQLPLEVITFTSSFPANTDVTLVASGDFEAKTTRQRPKLRATRLSPQCLR